jgi:hypothetical protein
MSIKKTLLVCCTLSAAYAAYDDYFGTKWSATFVAPTFTVRRTPDMITWEEKGMVYRGKKHITVKDVHLNQDMDIFQFAEILGEDEEYMDILPPEAEDLIRLYQENKENENNDEGGNRPSFCSPLPGVLELDLDEGWSV